MQNMLSPEGMTGDALSSFVEHAKHDEHGKVKAHVQSIAGHSKDR